VRPQRTRDTSGIGSSAPTAWVGQSVGPYLAKAAKSARTLMEQRLAEAGATFGQWTVLASLDSDGPMIQRALAEKLSIEGPTLTRHLERMQDRGLVRRTPSPTDRRAAVVELTEAGRTMCHRLELVARQANQDMLTGLSDDEISTLRGLLSRLFDNARAR